MKEKFKHFKPIQNMMVLALLVLLSILATKTSAIAQPLTRAQMAVILGPGNHGSNFTPPAATGIFDDVSVNDRAADWIEQFYNDGITSGCGQNPLRYCPTNPVTRAQMAIFLLRSKHGKNYTPPKATGIFDDVPVTRWAANWIEQLYREKITSGCSASPLRYCPDSSVTGVQTSIFVARTFGGPPAPVGVQWPDPRFTDNGDGTVTDNLTGLIWLKNAVCFESKTWKEALEASNNLADGQCGLGDGSKAGDWDLPNIRELQSLINYGEVGPALPEPNPFDGFGCDDPTRGGCPFWTETVAANGVEEVWTVDFLEGTIGYERYDSGARLGAWPVRGGN